jgi:2-dehydro-3-deoxyglucarate aldolase/4-hydroxy-2-oxoheptanedioate aldolase
MVAEVTAEIGFDFIVLDTEHPSYSLESLDTMISSVYAASKDALPIVRVPLEERNRVTRVLNMGAGGIIFPVIETAEEAQKAANAVKYPPEGGRTIAPGRGSRYLLDFEKYVETANDAVTTIVMIETERGLENADEIAAIEDVDAILIGHEDLSADLGIFAEWDSDILTGAIDRIVSAATDAGTPVGRVTPDPGTIADQSKVGYDYLVAGVDLWHLTQSLQRSYDSFANIFES